MHTHQPIKKKWYSLYDKVFNLKNLESAWEQVKHNRGSGGIDGVSITLFEGALKDNLSDIEHVLKAKTYRPQPVRRVYIPKANGKQRPLGIPTIRDRIVQQALLNVLQPIFEPTFRDCSYGFRPGRNAHQAIARIEECLKAGFTWVVDADITDFFGSVNHDRLLNAINAEVADGSVLKLITMFLRAGVMEDGQLKTISTGTPQGGVISPLLANIYLNSFDAALTQRGYRLVRYADDFVILCKRQKKAQRTLQVAIELLTARRLTVSQEKTRIVDYQRDSFEFLGFWFKRIYGKPRKGPRQKSREAFKNSVRFLTRRQQPRNLAMVIEQLNPTIRGWGNYFKVGDTVTLFARLDEWIRMRLRSFAKKKRWLGTAASTAYPNQRLAVLGLVSLSGLRKSA